MDLEPVGMEPETPSPAKRPTAPREVVRYLHDEGAEVAKGEAYIELEAMKMSPGGTSDTHAFFVYGP